MDLGDATCHGIVCTFSSLSPSEMAHESDVQLPTGARPHNTEKDSCTAFVSNLDYNLEEDRIKEIFSKVSTSIFHFAKV